MTSSTDPRGKTTSYSYDKLGRLTSKTDPLSDAWSYSYDKNGNLTELVDAASHTTDYSYDALNRLTGTDYPSGTPDEARSYDAASNLTGLSDGTGSSSFSYDGRDRLIEQDLPGSRTLTSQYDAAGNRTSLALPGSLVEHWTYDNAGRMNQASENSRATNLSYTHGRLTAVASPDSGSAISYDSAGRISEVNSTASATTLSDLAYSYDKASDVTRIDDGSNYATYSYDNLNRLTEENNVGAGAIDRTYAYDAAGNRSSMTVGANTTGYTYNNGEELTAADRPGTSDDSSLTYDANGNPASETRGSDTTNYSYDAANRLTGVDLPGGAPDETYAYDGLARRVSQTVGSDTTTNTFDGSDIALEQGPSSAAQYLRGPGGMLLSRYGASNLAGLSSASPVDYHSDAIGSVVSVSDTSGAEQAHYRYGAFGDVINQSGSLSQPYRYLSRAQDSSTGLDDFEARAYSPGYGRFLGRDPVPGALAKPQALNPYAYALDNPLSYRDPHGTSPDLVNSLLVGIGLKTEDAQKDADDAVASAATSVAQAAARPTARLTCTSLFGLYYFLDSGGCGYNVTWSEIARETASPYAAFAGRVNCGQTSEILDSEAKAEDGIALGSHAVGAGAFGIGLGGVALFHGLLSDDFNQLAHAGVC